MSCSSGAVAQKGRPFVHGFEIYLEKATLVYESGATPLTVLTADGKAEQPQARRRRRPDRRRSPRRFRRRWTASQPGKEPDLLSGKLARDALVLCHNEIESVRTGKAVAVG